jgi:hypothetical protein
MTDSTLSVKSSSKLNVLGVDLQWDQSPQLRGNGAHRQHLYNGHMNQDSHQTENKTPTHRVQSRRSGEMHHSFTSSSSASVPLDQNDCKSYYMEPPFLSN